MPSGSPSSRILWGKQGFTVCCLIHEPSWGCRLASRALCFIAAVLSASTGVTARDKVDRLEARTAFRAPEPDARPEAAAEPGAPQAVVVAGPDAPLEAAAAPDAQLEAAAELDAQREAVAPDVAVVAEPDAQQEAAVAVASGAQRQAAGAGGAGAQRGGGAAAGGGTLGGSGGAGGEAGAPLLGWGKVGLA